MDDKTDKWMDGKNFTTTTSFTICNPSSYAKPMINHQNFGKKKKLVWLHYKHNGTLWDPHDLWDVLKNN